MYANIVKRAGILINPGLYTVQVSNGYNSVVRAKMMAHAVRVRRIIVVRLAIMVVRHLRQHLFQRVIRALKKQDWQMP